MNTADIVNRETTSDNRVSSELPTVTVVIPMKDERDYIGKCLESVINQDYPKALTEILVVDGGSTDGSLEVVTDFMKHHANIKLLGGPGVNCPAAMNIGINEANGEIVAKVDAHGYPARSFLTAGIHYLTGDPTVKCVGGPIRPLAQGIIARAGVFARSSVFGVGKGVYSMGKSSGFVDSVQCGLYQKDVFRKVGLFDEALQFGEDEEINWRIRKKGYKIFSSPDIRFYYFSRTSFKALFKQYYNYGRLRVQVIRKHPDFFRPKHAMPPALVFCLLTTALVGTFNQTALIAFIGLASFYLIVSTGMSAAISATEGRRYLFLIPIGFAALHFGYGIGFLSGVCRLCLSR